MVERRARVTVSVTAPCRLSVAGELDLDTSGELASALAAASSDGQDVSVDLSGVTFLDSTGTRVLIRAHEALAARGATLLIVDASRAVLRTFELSGVLAFFRLRP